MSRIIAVAIVLAALAVAPAVPAHAARPAGTIVIDEGGANLTVKCRAGQRNVRVSAAGANIRVNGRCKEISVSGAGSRVQANVVDRIRVSGSYSHVSYRRSSSGGRASVRVTGVGARVTRRG